MKLRRWLTTLSEWLDTLEEAERDDARNTVEAVRKDLVVMDQRYRDVWRRLEQRIEALENRPTVDAMTYEAVNTGGGSVVIEATPLNVKRAADYSAAHETLDRRSRS